MKSASLKGLIHVRFPFMYYFYNIDQSSKNVTEYSKIFNEYYVTRVTDFFLLNISNLFRLTYTIQAMLTYTVGDILQNKFNCMHTKTGAGSVDMYYQDDMKSNNYKTLRFR
jgi:hypothetical protein